MCLGKVCPPGATQRLGDVSTVVFNTGNAVI